MEKFDKILISPLQSRNPEKMVRTSPHVLIRSGGPALHIQICQMIASVIHQSYFWRVFYVCPSCATVAMRRAPYVALLWSVTRSRSKPADNYLPRPAVQEHEVRSQKQEAVLLLDQTK